MLEGLQFYFKMVALCVHACACECACASVCVCDKTSEQECVLGGVCMCWKTVETIDSFNEGQQSCIGTAR